MLAPAPVPPAPCPQAAGGPQSSEVDRAGVETVRSQPMSPANTNVGRLTGTLPQVSEDAGTLQKLPAPDSMDVDGPPAVPAGSNAGEQEESVIDGRANKKPKTISAAPPTRPTRITRANTRAQHYHSEPDEDVNSSAEEDDVVTLGRATDKGKGKQHAPQQTKDTRRGRGKRNIKVDVAGLKEQKIKGKTRANKVDDEGESEAPAGNVGTGEHIGKKVRRRREAQPTGEYHLKLCSLCVRQGCHCEKEQLVGACVKCMQGKRKCDYAGGRVKSEAVESPTESQASKEGKNDGEGTMHGGTRGDGGDDGDDEDNMLTTAGEKPKKTMTRAAKTMAAMPPTTPI